MKLSLKKEALAKYVACQLENFFPDGIPCASIREPMDRTLERLERSFSAVHNKYFKENGETVFNHLNSDHYSMFLYLLSNTLYQDKGDIQVCEKIFYLNKLLNGIDAFYSVELPEIFLFCHPVGTVLGKARYNDYLLVYQNCTVGGNHEVNYPVLGKYVALYKGASVIGKCKVGDNCKISAHSLLIDRDLGPDEIYIGSPGANIIKKCSHHDSIWDPKK